MRATRKQRVPTKHQNVLKKTPPFKGVRKRKGGGKWVSEVRVPNSQQRIWLGSYDTPQQSARAYDYAVFCLRGAKAKFNFPNFSPLQNVLAPPSCSPAEIQAAAAKYALEGFQQPSQKGAAFSGDESPACIEGQLILEKDAAFFGNESQTCIDGPLILEEEDPALLDSLLQEFESGETANVDDFVRATRVP